MLPTRRDFLVGGGLAAGGLVLAGLGLPFLSAAAPATADITMMSDPLGTTVCLRFEQFHAVHDADDDAKVG